MILLEISMPTTLLRNMHLSEPHLAKLFSCYPYLPNGVKGNTNCFFSNKEAV